MELDEPSRKQLLEHGRKLLESRRRIQKKLNEGLTTEQLPVEEQEEAQSMFKYKIQALNSRIDSLIQENVAHENQNTKLKEEMDRLAKAKKAEEEEKLALNEQLCNKENEILYLKQTLEQKEEEITELNELIEQGGKTIKELKEENRESKEASNLVLSKIQVNLLEEQTENEKLKSRLKEMNELKQELTKLREEKTKWEEEREELEQKRRELSEELHHLSCRISEKESREGESIEAKKKLSEYKEKYESEMKTMNSLLSQQIETSKILTAKLRVLEKQKINRLRGVEDIMSEKKGFMEQLQKREQSILQEKQELQKRVDLLEKKLGHIERAEAIKFGELYEVIENLKNENSELKLRSKQENKEPKLLSNDTERLKTVEKGNERLSQRLRDTRSLLQTKIREKSELIEKVNEEMQRNALLSQQLKALKTKHRSQPTFLDHNSAVISVGNDNDDNNNDGNNTKNDERENSRKEAVKRKVEEIDCSLLVTNSSEKIVLETKGWFSWLPFWGYRTYDATVEFVV